MRRCFFLLPLLLAGCFEDKFAKACTAIHGTAYNNHCEWNGVILTEAETITMADAIYRK